MTGKLETIYAQTLTGGLTRPRLEENLSADVCVIGGGLAGINVALGLVQRGKSVVLLESRCLGWGASGRNGGFVLGGYAAGPYELYKKLGASQARQIYGLTLSALKLIRQRAKDFGIPCDITDGHLKCSWYDEPESQKKTVDFLKENFGENIEFWPREKVRDVCRTDRYYDAYFYPGYFHMNPLGYIQGLAGVIESKGGRIFEYSPALAVEETSSGSRVKTASGTVHAAHIVYCGSAYFNGLEKRLSRACLPVSTYVMVTEPLSREKMASAITKPYAIRDTRWTDDYYRILPDNSLLWGGRVGLGTRVPANLDRAMLGDLLKIYPQLEGVRVKSAWAGIMGYTTHKMPHIGRLRDGVWSCTNFGGNGLGPTTAGGEMIAAAIAQGDETYKLFERFGHQWTGGPLGPLVAQGVYYSWGIADALHETGNAFKRAQRKKAAARRTAR